MKTALAFRFSAPLLQLALLNGAVIILQAQTPPEPATETQLIDRAQALIAAGQLADADRLLETAVRRYPHSGGLYNLIGIAAAQRSEKHEAETAFRQAVKESPTLVPAYLNLARIQYENQQGDAAVETYGRVLRIDNRLEEAHANLAALLLSRGSYAEAQQQLQALPSQVRDQNRFRSMQCAALAGSGKLTEAQGAAGAMQRPYAEGEVSLSAFTLAKLGQNSLVIQLIEPALSTGTSKELRGLLATAYAQIGRLADARATFESVLSEDPGGEQPLVDLARVAYRQNDFEGSAGYLLRALKVDKENAQLQFFFGIVCIQLNLPGDALAALKEAVRLVPDNAPFNYALGAALLSGDKSGDAASYFRKYIQLRPGDPHGRFALGVAEFEVRDNDAARRELLPLTRDPAVSSGAHYILGKVCRSENDYKGAREHFLEALKTDARNPDLLVSLATVELREDRLTEARRELDRALALDPENYLANEDLLLLLRRTKDPAAEQQARKFASVTQKASDEQKLLLRHIDLRRLTD